MKSSNWDLRDSDFQVQIVTILFYSILFYSIQILFDSIQILLYSIRFDSIRFYYIQIIFYYILLYSLNYSLLLFDQIFKRHFTQMKFDACSVMNGSILLFETSTVSLQESMVETSFHSRL